MSQYPSPYSPPAVVNYYGLPVDLFRPARRASLMMWVMGVLMILFSGCMIGMTFMFSMMPAEQLQPMRTQLASITSMSAEQLFRVAGSGVLVVGLILIVLGFFVRRGSLGATIVASVFVGLLILQPLLSAVAALVGLGQDPTGIGNLCVSVITLSLFALMLIWLILAAIAAPKIRRAQQQYAAQYWQYQQSWQAYQMQSGQQEYGTGGENVSPPPPPSAG